MIDLDFGTVLGIYFTESAKKYDKSSLENADYIYMNTQGNKAKFNKFKMQIKIFEYFLLKLILYSVSFIFKILQYFYLIRAKSKNKISKIAAKTDDESKSGKHNHSILPFLDTKAADLQFPITP